MNNKKYELKAPGLETEIPLSDGNRADFQKVLELLGKVPKGQKPIKAYVLHLKDGTHVYN